MVRRIAVAVLVAGSWLGLGIVCTAQENPGRMEEVVQSRLFCWIRGMGLRIWNGECRMHRLQNSGWGR